MTLNRPNLVFIGFMGAGKSTIGRRAAKVLNRPFVDLDEEIESRSGKSIAQIFAVDGEQAFRRLETQILQEAAGKKGIVIAAGGGAAANPENLTALRRNGILVFLDPPFPVLLDRIISQGSERPLGRLGPEGLQDLYLQRLQWYELADFRVPITKGEGAEAVTAKALALLDPSLPCISVQTPSADYPYYLTTALPGQAELANFEPTKALLVSDDKVRPLYGQRITGTLEGAGWQVAEVSVSAGEQAKNLRNVEMIWERGFDHGLDRQGAIFALGGGVIGDLAGFAAATYMRGIRFFVIPTTLLAMVDSSIGGKVGVNHPRGKNLIGAFHHPSAVFTAVGVLSTLDPRNLAAGWAEVVKSALIGDPAYYHYLATKMPALSSQETQAEGVLRSAKVKEKIVRQDEFEQGIRKYLNLGHTLGHGLEQALGYGTLLHGEAVSIGLVAAAFAAERLGVAQASLKDQVRQTLGSYGLPVGWPEGAQIEQIVESVALDKKNRSGLVSMILPVRPGEMVEKQLTVKDFRRLMEDFRGENLC